MRGSIFVALTLLIAGPAFAQGGRGSISGTLTSPDGDPVPGAHVQVKSVSSGVILDTETSRTGRYTVADLPAGTYELSVPVIGFTFSPFSRKDLLLQAGQTLRADVRLEWAANLGTVGDDTFLTI